MPPQHHTPASQPQSPDDPLYLPVPIALLTCPHFCALSASALRVYLYLVAVGDPTRPFLYPRHILRAATALPPRTFQLALRQLQLAGLLRCGPARSFQLLYPEPPEQNAPNSALAQNPAPLSPPHAQNPAHSPSSAQVKI